MSEHTWSVDSEADAHRIANATLPAAFWKALAGLAGDLVSAASTGEFIIDGDVLKFGRSYIDVRRDGRRLATLPMRTIIRANAIAKNEAKAAAEAKIKKTPAVIEWEP